MLKQLLDALLPLPAISRELKRLADLYEISLAERMISADSTAAPVMLRREQPRRDDTEISYGSDELTGKRKKPDASKFLGDEHDMGWENEG